MTRRIDITVAAIIETDARFLLVEEEAGRRKVFNQPAGHLEPGESLTEAVIRETFEETSFAFEPTALLGLYLWHCDEADTTFLRVAFCGEANASAVVPSLDEGILAAHWFTRAQIVSRGPRLRSPLVLRCLDDHLAGTHYPLSVISELPVEEIALLSGS